jgi:16S rRNA (cytosine1402-N4)-methyltransferase
MSGPAPSAEPRHVSVMPAEVLAALAPLPGQTLVDATVGAGGHARLLAERIPPAGRLVGLDRDPTMLELSRRRLADLAVTLVHANFDQLREVLDELGIAMADGVLADLGVCSDQIDQAERGFSFQRAGPLDMRLDPTQGEPAGNLLRRLSERDLADLFWKYGEERFSRRIARRIVELRKQRGKQRDKETGLLKRTEELAELVRRCVPRPRGPRTGIDPATRVFQALRIAVNDELGALDRFLEALPGCVRPGGRVAILSFHSLEDRRVKRAFRDRRYWRALTPKPLRPGEEEIRNNPRSRSAKLRAALRNE